VAFWYVEIIPRFISPTTNGSPAPIEPELQYFSIVAFSIVGVLSGFLLSSLAFRKITEIVPRIEALPVEDKFAGAIGIVLGLAVAYLLHPVLYKVPYVGALLVLLCYFLLVILGAIVTFSMKKELVGMLALQRTEEEAEETPPQPPPPKLLDTNIIIDGRLLDICETGFIEGDILVPSFVLDELHSIADSADNLKRARGRRGLDMLQRMKQEIPNFSVLDPPYPVKVDDIEGVDAKLVKLATSMEACILTNDFNLTKVAELQGIKALNVNKLATALKPVVMVGEELTVNVIREGKDVNQGVAYLEDGTMVVIENGQQHIGEVIDVVVTSVLQTVAGKMIFASVKS